MATPTDEDLAKAKEIRLLCLSREDGGSKGIHDALCGNTGLCGQAVDCGRKERAVAQALADKGERVLEELGKRYRRAGTNAWVWTQDVNEYLLWLRCPASKEEREKCGHRCCLDECELFGGHPEKAALRSLASPSSAPKESE